MFLIRQGMAKSAVLFNLTLTVSAAALANEQFSSANQMLFATDHLQSISTPTVLHYAFKKTAPGDTGFSDSINLRISEVNEDGTKNVELEYFTGDRHRYAPEVSNASGNPVITLYLQRDVNEMGRLTEGSWRHFQKRIKLALQETKNVSSVRVRFEGRQLDAREIRIAPYRNDPMRDRYVDYADKYYVFTLAPEVPGYVLEIKSVVPGRDDADAVVEEVLSYTGQSRPQ